MTWDRETDVVVIGFGAAGGVAAIEAADQGAEVLLCEKMPDPGGLSIISAGGIRIAEDSSEALRYLEATCGERTPRDVLAALATGMTQVPAYLQRLAEVSGATVSCTPALGNYPLPGTDTLGFAEVAQVPALDGCDRLHAVRGPLKGGARLFKVLEDNIARRPAIQVRYNTVAQRLIAAPDKTVLGVRLEQEGQVRQVRARRGVILACGGFEANEEMKRQYFQAQPVTSAAFRGNTGDGITMAQDLGAALWHMWHYHGPYGLRHPDPAYPFGLFLKVMPMWTPSRLDKLVDLGVTNAGGAPEPARTLPELAWILLDQDGLRFMDEYPPYLSDTGVRPLDHFDPKQQRFPRIPAYLIFDEGGRRLYPMGRSVANDRDYHYEWSADNRREIEAGIIQQADTLAGLAERLGLPAEAMAASVDRWNQACATGEDAEFGRRPETMRPLCEPPFYGAPVWPLVINTQGGPVHNARQQILDVFGLPIPRLFAAGELGSVFGHLYVAGGNLAECFVGGWTAAREAAALPPCDPAPAP